MFEEWLESDQGRDKQIDRLAEIVAPCVWRDMGRARIVVVAALIVNGIV